MESQALAGVNSYNVVHTHTHTHYFLHVSMQCSVNPKSRKYTLPLSRERLGEIEAMVGLHHGNGG